MRVLYVVAESEYDAYFYALCAEWMTGLGYEVAHIKSRKRSGYRAVQSLMGEVLHKARGEAEGGAEVCFLGAIDNDRAPHPENAAMDRSRLIRKERTRASRHDWMMETVFKKLGHDRTAWPLPVALGVPVEMIEAWVFRACCEDELQPPRYFSHADSQRARDYYPSTPPPQWKDLARDEQERCGHSDKRDFYLHAVLNLDAAALAERSLSFRMFKEWLDAWPNGGAAIRHDGEKV